MRVRGLAGLTRCYFVVQCEILKKNVFVAEVFLHTRTTSWLAVGNESTVVGLLALNSIHQSFFCFPDV